MAVPNTQIKNALSFTAASEGAAHPYGGGTARTVGNDALARFQAALENAYTFVDAVGDPRSADANDAAAWLWKQAAGFTKQEEDQIAEAALAAPSELDDA